MAKLGWGLLNEEDALWTLVLREKYVRHEPLVVNDFTDSRQSSNAWKGIMQAKPILEKGLRATVGNGMTVRFWLDKWISDEPLINSSLVEIGLVEKYRMVKSYRCDMEG